MILAPLRFSPSSGPELRSRILGLLNFDPIPKELLRRSKAERRMTTTAVIEHFDIFEQVGLRVLVRSVARGVHPLVFQAIEEAFRRGIDAPMSRESRRFGQISPDEGVQLADDIALQAAMDFFVRHAFLCPTINVGPGSWIAAHPNHGNGP